MFSTLIKIPLIIVGACLSFVAFVWYIESQSIFYPSRSMEVTPQDAGLSYEDIYFTTADGMQINGWLIKHPAARATLVVFHGNAGNISHRLDKIKFLRQADVNVFMIDYRGYGKSEGRPSEQGMYLDALAAFDYLLTRPDIDPKAIIAYGTSLGGVAAVELAIQRPVAALIIESSITSSADVSRVVFPFIPTMLLRTKMDNATKIQTITVPKLIIHSINDEIIPFEQGKRLFEAARDPKEFLEIIGGHNTAYIDSREKFSEGLKLFLNRYGFTRR